MKGKICIILVLLMLVASSVNALSLITNEDKLAESEESKNKIEYIPGQIIVRYKDNLKIGSKTISELNDMMVFDSNEALVVSKNNKLNTVLAEIEPGEEQNFIDNVKKDSNVKYVTKNFILSALRTPNDPYFSDYQWAPKKMRCMDMWDDTTGSSSVKIAIIDSGIDLNHPDLKDNIIQGRNFVNKLTPNNPEDDNGHGTHCAGIAAAIGNNGKGIAGIAWNCKIMPVKVLNEEGAGTLADISDGITWAANNGANVISLSLGIDIELDADGDGNPDVDVSELQPLEDACNYAWDSGTIVVAAAGNAGRDAKNTYPAAYEKVISIGACAQDTGRPWFSNYGKTSVDFIAPGVNIYSTMPTYQVELNKEGLTKDYSFASGTSSACPNFAGVCALVKSKNPDMTNQEIWDLLIDTSDQWDHESSEEENTIEEDKDQRNCYMTFFDLLGKNKKVVNGLVDASLTLPEDEAQTIEPTVTIKVHKVVGLDPIDIATAPEWYYRLGLTDYYGHSEDDPKYFFHYSLESTEIWTPNKVHEYEHKADWKYQGVGLDIKLMEDDDSILEGFDDDLADISGDCWGCDDPDVTDGGKDNGISDEKCAQFEVWYRIDDDFYTKINNNAWEIRDGWHVASGELGPDGDEEGDQNDAEVWFDISDNWNVDEYKPEVKLSADTDLDAGNNLIYKTLKITNDGNIDPYYLQRIPWFRTNVDANWLRFIDRNGRSLCMQLEGCLAPKETWLGVMVIDPSNMENGKTYTATITVEFRLLNNPASDTVDTETIQISVTKEKTRSKNAEENNIFNNFLDMLFDLNPKLLDLISKIKLQLSKIII
jgi:thermitase